MKFFLNYFIKKMIVNKFGLRANNTSQRGPPGIGFKILDREGNYDMQNKRLANLKQSESQNDAITKGEINNLLNETQRDIYKTLDEKTVSVSEEINNKLSVHKTDQETVQSEIKENIKNKFLNLNQTIITERNNLLQTIDNKVTEIYDEMVNDLSGHKSAQEILLENLKNELNQIIISERENLLKTINKISDETTDNFTSKDILFNQLKDDLKDKMLSINELVLSEQNKSVSFQETMSKNYSYLNEQNLNLLKAVTELSDSLSNVDISLNENRAKFQEIELNVNDLKNEINVISDVTQDIIINNQEIGLLRDEINNIKQKLQ